MRKVVLPVVIVLLGLCAVLFLPQEQGVVSESYIRVHIRAHSNAGVDQAVKFEVKESVVTFLTPFIAQCNNMQDVKQVLESNLSGIEAVANEVLKNRGLNYESSAQLNNEFFPSRYYDDILLSADYYDALVINLGSGTGDNWWCVVYPPLCFINNGNKTSEKIIYKSKFVELAKKFFS